jgi:hypothetical protein
MEHCGIAEDDVTFPGCGYSTVSLAVIMEHCGIAEDTCIFELQFKLTLLTSRVMNAGRAIPIHVYQCLRCF